MTFRLQPINVNFLFAFPKDICAGEVTWHEISELVHRVFVIVNISLKSGFEFRESRNEKRMYNGGTD